MAAEKKRKSGEARPGFVRGSWRDKVNPIFVAWCASQKRNRALAKIKDVNEFDRRFDEWYREAVPLSRAIIEARSQINDSFAGMLLSEIMQGLDIGKPSVGIAIQEGQESTIRPENPESSPLFRWLVFLKHGSTFPQLVYQIDIEKSRAAHRKLMAVHRDYWKMLSGYGHENLKLKFNWDHFFLITEGLDFGLDKLTPEELAGCLDVICPCAQKHSPEYLKKVRTAIQQACDRYRKPVQS